MPDLFQAVRLLDTIDSDPARVLQDRLVGELLADTNRVQATLNPAFEVIMHAAATTRTLSAEAVVESIRRNGEAGVVTWVELEDLLINTDVLAGRGLLGSLKLSEGMATTMPLAVFIRFAGGRMMHEEAFLGPSSSTTVQVTTLDDLRSRLHGDA